MIDRTAIEPITVSDVIRRAAVGIQECGHAKSALRDKNGGMCALGALVWAVTGNPESISDTGICPQVVAAAHLTLGQHLGVEVVSWNNHPDRTADEVVGAMIACAEIADLGI